MTDAELTAAGWIHTDEAWPKPGQLFYMHGEECWGYFSVRIRGRGMREECVFWRSFMSPPSVTCGMWWKPAGPVYEEW